MIITRTPFRVSFAGGGSDFPAYYEKFGGAVLSVTINKYMYLSLHPFFGEDKYFLKYSRNELVSDVNAIEHPVLREVFRMYGIRQVDFNSSADIPAGTGLASSSAFTVGLIHLCDAFTGRYQNRREMARLACEVEMDKLGEPIGKQDQYACACGGLNFIEFLQDGTINVERLFLPAETLRIMERRLCLFYLGHHRRASSILSEQKKNLTDRKILEPVHRVVRLARDLKEELLCGNVDALGEILHEGWMCKKRYASGITRPEIDDAYERARAAGATGGKLLGAGGGGFLLVYVPEEKRDAVYTSLGDLHHVPFRLESQGTQIVYRSDNEPEG